MHRQPARRRRLRLGAALDAPDLRQRRHGPRHPGLRRPARPSATCSRGRRGRSRSWSRPTPPRRAARTGRRAAGPDRRADGRRRARRGGPAPWRDASGRVTTMEAARLAPVLEEIAAALGLAVERRVPSRPRRGAGRQRRPADEPRRTRSLVFEKSARQAGVAGPRRRCGDRAACGRRSAGGDRRAARRFGIPAIGPTVELYRPPPPGGAAVRDHRPGLARRVRRAQAPDHRCRAAAAGAALPDPRGHRHLRVPPPSTAADRARPARDPGDR